MTEVTEVAESVPEGIDVSESSIADLQKMLNGEETDAVAEVTAKPDATAKPVKAEPKAETEPDSDPEDDQEQADDKPQSQRGINRKFQKLTGKIRDLETQLAARPAAAAERKPEVATLPVVDPNEPVAASFDTYEAYVKALTKYEIGQAAKASDTRAAVKTVSEKWEAAKTEARTRIADFDEFADAEVPVSPIMNDAILQSEIGADLAYHLGKHPEEAARIYKLAPLAAAIAIGKLEATILASRKAPETKTTATAKPLPKPPVVVGGSSTPVVKELDDMDMADFKAAARKQLKRATF